MHASRFQWHNDNPDYDSYWSLRHLNLGLVKEAGYVNLRCVWVLGCPSEIRPFEDEAASASKKEDDDVATKDVFKKAFQELLPELEVPSVVGVSCCSQFAVTRETIRRRPRSDYIRFQQWLISTALEDGLSGRVLEYMWHSESAFLLLHLLCSTVLPPLMSFCSNIRQIIRVLSRCFNLLLSCIWSVQPNLRVRQV
jgi:hypothetical protein